MRDRPGSSRTGAIVKLLFIVGFTVVLPLAIIAGIRLSSDALGIVIGAACAGLPLAGLVALCLVLLFRNRPGQQSSQPAQQYPPVIVVQGADTRQLPYGQQMPASLPAPSNHRNFHVVGSDADVFDWEDGR